MVFCIICIPRIRTRKRVVRAQPGYVYEIRRQPCQPNNPPPQIRANPQQQLRPQQPSPVTHTAQPSATTGYQQNSPIPQKTQASAPYPSEPPPPYTKL